MESEPRYLATLPYSTTSAPHDSLREIGVGFLCGCFGGVGNILSSHSLDTVKVRMQLLDMKFTNCCRYMVRKEGLGAFYKGVTSPLFNVPIIYAMYFGAYELGKWMQRDNPRQELTISQYILAGICAAFPVCSVITPVELVKCRLQMQGTGKKVRTTTAFALTKQIVHQHGIRELYKGSVITLLREIPACAVYFGTYEYSKKELQKVYGDNQFIPIAAGGLAGLLSWAASYPQDVIKTKLQCDDTLVRRYPQSKLVKDGGIISCTREVWRKDGLRGFTRGFSACSIKAIVAEATTFFIFENTKKCTKY